MSDVSEVSQGKPITPYVCPRGHHSVEIGKGRFSCRSCLRQGFETRSWPRSELVDLRDEEPPLVGDVPDDDAGGRRPTPRDASTIDVLYYTAGRAGCERRYHVSEDCSHMLLGKRVLTASAGNLGRGEVCERCGGELTIEDIHDAVETDRREREHEHERERGARREPGDRERWDDQDARAQARRGRGDQLPGCEHESGVLPCLECFSGGGNHV